MRAAFTYRADGSGFRPMDEWELRETSYLHGYETGYRDAIEAVIRAKPRGFTRLCKTLTADLRRRLALAGASS